jgi:hypothetical protein
MVDYNLANQSGAQFRAELNQILAALQSCAFGPTQPATRTAGQIWVDSSGSNPVLRVRNAQNTAWIAVGTLAAGGFELAGSTVTGRALIAAADAAAARGTLGLGNSATTNLASQAQAEAGTDNGTTMTPLRTAQNVTARIATQAEAEAGTNNTKLMTPLRTAQAIATLQTVPALVGPISTTSGTAFDVQNIPSWVRQITVSAVGIGLNGGSHFLIQLGTSDNFITTGYTASTWAPDVGSFTSTSGFIVMGASAAARFHGHVSITLLPSSTAVSSHCGYLVWNTYNVFGGGSVAIPNPITRLRLTQTGGNNFTAGSVFVRYSA